MDVKKYFISVCIIAKPGENMSKLNESLNEQTYKNFEVVLHQEFDDFPKLRNRVIAKSKGELIAFTDADCYVEKHWLEEINNAFQDKDIVGVWGKVCYELKNGAMPTISTRIVDNNGDRTVTANASFRGDLLRRVKFDEDFYAAEDKILNERLKPYGKLIYNNKIIVFHTYQKWTFKSIIKHSKKVEDILKMHYKYNIPFARAGPIVYPSHWLVILFPPIIFIVNAIRSPYDVKIALGNYLEKICIRFLIWKFAIKNKKFLI